jgi:membrane protease YdiL (CAAX protease family)
LTIVFDITNRRDFVSLAVLFEGSLAGLAFGLGWWFQVDPLAQFTCDLPALAWGVGAVIPLFGLFLVGNRFPIGPLRAIKQFLLEALGPSLAACRWHDLLLVALVAGAGEELLFRGLLQPLTGIIWSNILFGLAHAITPLYALLAGLIGLCMGWLLDSSGSLVAPIVAHGLYDFLAFLVVARASRVNHP